MTNVCMKAIDTLHISSVSQHSIGANDEFEVPTHVADDLEKRGLATPVEAKQAPAPENKAEPQAENKAAKPVTKGK